MLAGSIKGRAEQRQRGEKPRRLNKKHWETEGETQKTGEKPARKEPNKPKGEREQNLEKKRNRGTRREDWAKNKGRNTQNTGENRGK